MKVIKMVRGKLSGRVTDEAKIKLAVDEAESAIKNYCNIETVPEALHYTWANMAVDILTKQELILNNASIDTGNSDSSAKADSMQAVKSFSVDGIGMTFVTAEEANSQYLKELASYTDIDALISNYTNILDNYRKLKW